MPIYIINTDQLIKKKIKLSRCNDLIIIVQQKFDFKLVKCLFTFCCYFRKHFLSSLKLVIPLLQNKNAPLNSPHIALTLAECESQSDSYISK